MEKTRKEIDMSYSELVDLKQALGEIIKRVQEIEDAEKSKRNVFRVSKYGDGSAYRVMNASVQYAEFNCDYFGETEAFRAADKCAVALNKYHNSLQVDSAT